MQPQAYPYFADDQLLSAFQVNSLAEILNDVRGAALGPSMAQETLTFNNSTYRYSNPYYYRSRKGHVVHRHDATYADCEYLYYDVTLSRSSSGQGGDMALEIWYKSTLLETLTLTSATDSQRQGGFLSLNNFPTAGTHPKDGEAVPVSIRIATTDDPGTVYMLVTVHRLEEVVLPDSDVYTAMDDATALTDGEDDDVAADLATVAANTETLVDMMRQSVVGFWQTELNIDGEIPIRTSEAGAYSVAATWYWNTTNAGKLYYRMCGWQDNYGYDSAKLQVKFEVDDTEVGSVIEWTTRSFPEYTPWETKEASIDISAVSRNNQEWTKCELLARYVNPGDDGAGEIYVDYIYEGI
jgi:hypothetical protein